MYNIGIVPTFKIENVGTVPMFKMHNLGILKIYNLCLELEFGSYDKNQFIYSSHLELEIGQNLKLSQFWDGWAPSGPC